jgi:hypothetical protein
VEEKELRVHVKMATAKEKLVWLQIPPEESSGLREEARPECRENTQTSVSITIFDYIPTSVFRMPGCQIGRKNYLFRDNKEESSLERQASAATIIFCINLFSIAITKYLLPGTL